jgi:cytoskeleton protein RodZ
MSPGPWIAAIVVVVVAAASYFWFASRSEPDPDPATAIDEELLPEQAAEDLSGRQETILQTTTLPEEAPVTSQPVAGDPVADTTQQAETADGVVLLSLNFSGDCWTEISDATGRRLFFDMGRAGRTVELSGQAPFDVLFGNTENVSVRVNGSAYTVTPLNPGSRTARLTIMHP